MLKGSRGTDWIVLSWTGSPTEETVAAFSKLLTYETLANLHFLHAALSETLRLFPAVAAVSLCRHFQKVSL
jgi:hypothetical protein